MKEKTLKALGYSAKEVLESGVETFLLKLPTFLWEKEVKPVLEALGLPIPKHQFNVNAWLNYKKFINTINRNQFEVIIKLVNERMTDEQKMRLFKNYLYEVGIEVKHDDDGGYSFVSEDGGTEAVRFFLTDLMDYPASDVVIDSDE